MYGNEISAIEGLTPTKAFVSNGEDVLVLICAPNSKRVTIALAGDCCSESWWADITGFDALRGHMVTKAEEVVMPAPEDGRSRQDEDEAYSVVLTTTGGRCEMVFRNSSNGYYGGWIESVRVDSHDESQADTFAGYREITSDWSA